MEIRIKSKIKGAFEGFKRDRVFELFDESKWRQIVDRDTIRKSTNPVAHILTNNGRYYLEVLGIEKTVEVQLFS